MPPSGAKFPTCWKMHRRASHAIFIHRRGFSTFRRECIASQRVAGPYDTELRLNPTELCDGNYHRNKKKCNTGRMASHPFIEVIAGVWCSHWEMILALTKKLRGDSTYRPITPTRGTKRPTSGTLKKYLVGVTDLFSRQINIINLSIVLQPPTSHWQISWRWHIWSVRTICLADKWCL